jgi:hypothetical protein
VYAPKGSKSINTILLSRIILFLFLLIFLVVLVVFVALLRKGSGLTLRDKVHNFTRTPLGVIKLKKKEFQDLKQGTMTVSESEYVIHFMQLSPYAPNDVDTDEKKQECFLNGLNDGLAYALEARDFENFQDMVNKAFVLENRRAILECMCKQERQGQQSGKSQPHFDSSSARPIFHPVQKSFQQMPQPKGQGFSILKTR